MGLKIRVNPLNPRHPRAIFNMDLTIFPEIIDQFSLMDPPSGIQNWGEGHIHETYLVETSGHHPDYILQKINHNIFKDIPGMMANIEAVTRHLKGKSLRDIGHGADHQSLSLVYTRSGNSYYEDKDGNFWRMYFFIPDTLTFQLISDPILASEAGRAIGLFQANLVDLQDPLVETIKEFHSINLRISQYEQAKSENRAGRAGEVTGDLSFAESRFERMCRYFSSLKEKAVVRVTHNDTKLNNILFDKNHKALCLIDLDTVMPGYVHFDYGDALRTMANTAPEDEKVLSNVHFNKEVFESFTRGYLEIAGDFLTEEEKALLPYAPVYLTFIIGLRFLTDYLNGDVYYRVHHPGHNLERARVQFKLVQEIEFALNFDLAHG